MNDFVIGPIGERSNCADQFLSVKSGHPTEGPIDIRDASLVVERPHTGQHRVFHCPAKSRLCEGLSQRVVALRLR